MFGSTETSISFFAYRMRLNFIPICKDEKIVVFSKLIFNSLRTPVDDGDIK
jgi:hypothetical protein